MCERGKGREGARQRAREPERRRDRLADREIEKCVYIHTYIHTYRLTEGHTDGQTDRQRKAACIRQEIPRLRVLNNPTRQLGHHLTHITCSHRLFSSVAGS